MTERRYDEKQEKAEEKEVEKRDEKQDEKSVEEKYRRDPVSATVWAIILIWTGVVFLADNLGWLSAFRTQNIFPGTNIPFMGLGAWSLVFTGAGVILLLEVIFRLSVPAYRGPVGGTLVLAAVFLGIGLGNIFGWNVVWPLILIALGLSFLVRGLLRRR